MVRTFFRQPFDDVIGCLEHIMTVGSPFKQLAPMLISMVVTWFIYVPIHELLHVAGVVAPGGAVSVLEVAPRYGGTILAEHIPWVVSGGAYAGRLSGFDTRGSDLIYLSCVFMPFVLSVLIGVPLVKICMKRRRPILFGVAIVVGLAPFYNTPGDYFEMGSIMTTRVLTLFAGGGNPPVFVGIRSDDVFALIANIFTQTGATGLAGIGATAVLLVIVGVSLVVDVLLAFATYALGCGVAQVLVTPIESAPGGQIAERTSRP
ncbi:MAG: hypothetical protein ACYTFA_03760 [Planctomycetota bacterium]